MSKKIFDYPDTCPTLVWATAHIEELFNNLKDELVDMVSSKEEAQLIENYVNATKHDIKFFIDKVRQTNVEMREEANKQMMLMATELETLILERGRYE